MTTVQQVRVPSVSRCVLVCGGRDYGRATHLFEVLDAFHGDVPFTRLVHGGARGADSLAGLWARKSGVTESVEKADWNTHRMAAGPIRNKRMLDVWKPDLVIAFPGGAGTANMVKQSRRRKFPVIEVPE